MCRACFIDKGGIFVRKKIIACCTSLGAGAVMLVGIGVGQGIGNLTENTILAVARNPILQEEITELFDQGIWRMIMLLITAFIIAIVLLCLSRTCSYRQHGRDGCHTGHHRRGSLTCVFSVLAIALALAGGIAGAALGISTAEGGLILGFAQNPILFDLLEEFAIMGSRLALLPLAASIIIAIAILWCWKCACWRPVCRYDYDISSHIYEKLQDEPE